MIHHKKEGQHCYDLHKKKMQGTKEVKIFNDFFFD